MPPEPPQSLRDLFAILTGKEKRYRSRTPGLPTASAAKKLLAKHNAFLQVVDPDSKYRKFSSPSHARQLLLPFDKLASAYNRNSSVGVAMRLLKDSDPQMRWKPMSYTSPSPSKQSRRPFGVETQNPRFTHRPPLSDIGGRARMPLAVTAFGDKSTSYDPLNNQINLNQTDEFGRLLPFTAADLAGDVVHGMGHEFRHAKDYYPTNNSPIPKGKPFLDQAMKGGYFNGEETPFATKLETRAALAQILLMKKIFGAEGVVNHPGLRTHIEMSRNQPNYHVGARKGEKYLNRLLRKLTGKEKPNFHKLVRESFDRRMSLEEPGGSLFSDARPQLGISLADDNP